MHERPETLITYGKPECIEGVEYFSCRDVQFNMSAHTHEAYVFWINCAGGENVDIRGCRDILQPDSFGVVAPGDVHGNNACSKERRLLSIYVREEVLNDVATQMGCPGEAPVAFASRLYGDRQSHRALRRLHGFLRNGCEPGRTREVFLETCAMLLQRHGQVSGVKHRLGASGAKVSTAKAIIRERLAESVPLETFAEECGCTVYHLIRLFRREVGMTPHAWLMNMRILHAQRLLGTGMAPGQVAAECGFSDQSHLSRRFKARFGATPGMYRCQVFRPHRSISFKTA